MTPITTDLTVSHQGLSVDVESIAPLTGFTEDSYDVANMTLVARVHSPAEDRYRLVLPADVESGTSALARVVSATDSKFKDVATFRRLTQAEAVKILEPVLVKMGRWPSDPTIDREDFLEGQAKYFKITDLTIPAGDQVLRIHASQKLLPVDGDPRHYRLELYAPHLSLAPTSNVELGVTVLFPLGFAGQIAEPTVAALPGQPLPNILAGGPAPVTVADHRVFGWHFKSDPVVTFDYRY